MLRSDRHHVIACAVAMCFATACSSGDTRSAIASIGGGGDRDPCTLLSAGESEVFVGPLASPPYRSNDGSAVGKADGEQCTYRGRDGRQVSILPLWSGGGMIGGMLKDMPKAIGAATSKGSAKGMDSMAGRVLQSDEKGPWDNETWIPGGSLLVYKGDAQIRVDVTGASGKKADALAIGRIIVPRMAAPLSYSGSKAVALAPKARKVPANACDVVPRALVEGAIGRLDGAPVPDSSGSGCTYRVATAGGEETYPVEFVWDGGQKNYNMLKHGLSMMTDVMGTPGEGVMDSVNLPPEAKQMLGSLVQMMGSSNSPKGAKPAAKGAIAQVGIKSDTMLVGPWDNASLLHGTQLIAVKQDVFVGMTLQSANYDKAKALMTAICSRL